MRTFFYVLSMNPSRAKVIRTADGLQSNPQGSSCVRIQPMSSVLSSGLAASGSTPSLNVRLCIDGLPKNIDLSSFVPWTFWRQALRSWSEDTSINCPAGLIAYKTEATFMELPQDLPLSDAPLTFLLEKLAAIGWRGGRSHKDPHSTASKLLCLEKGFSSRRSYFLIMFSIDALLEEKYVLHCGQPDSYYQLLLAVPFPEKHLIKPGLGDAWYKLVLSQLKAGQPLLPLPDKPPAKKRKLALDNEIVFMPLLPPISDAAVSSGSGETSRPVRAILDGDSEIEDDQDNQDLEQEEAPEPRGGLFVPPPPGLTAAA